MGHLKSSISHEAENQLIVVLNKILLNRLLGKLKLKNEEELYALYLSQDRELHILAKTTGVPSENLDSCIAFVINLIGQNAVEKMDAEYEILKTQDMFFGSFNPENDKP
jgi:hypothetical protein